MTPHPQRAPLPPQSDLGPAITDSVEDSGFDPGLDPVQWESPEAQPEPTPRATGGRAVLGWALSVLALLWIGFTGWSAGRALANQPLSAPAVAQWIAIAAGPLALLGLAWIMFGRTRRREAERFTRSVVAMRHEARSLEGLLAVLSQRIDDGHAALGSMAERLMGLGEEATGRLGAVTRELESSSERLTVSGQALDQAAESARTDIGILLDDLPRAEASARAVAEQLRGVGSDAAARTGDLAEQVTALSERTREADELVGAAGQRLVAHLTHIESAGAAAAARVSDAEASFSTALDSLLERAADSLDQIRRGIDAQSAAVTALVDQASAGIGRSGLEASDALGTSIARAGSSLDGLSARVAEQERASQRMFAEVDSGLTLIDQRFAELASQGDERANHFLASLALARTELDALAGAAESQDSSIETLAERTAVLRAGIERLSADIREGLVGAMGEAHGNAERMLAVTAQARPEIDAMRQAATEASERIQASGTAIAEQQERMTALLGAIDDGAGTAENRLAGLASALALAQHEAARLTAEVGPALVEAMVQLRDTAALGASRARETIAEVIPEAASKLSKATRIALEEAIRDGIEERLRNVETVAAKAVETARAAADRLSQQMLSLGQSATALEQHLEQTREDTREKDSEAFARRVALLIDSMHSAAIDVGKILSDEIDDKAWTAYLKGNRGVFTRRAVQLIGGGESRAIRAHYDVDPEFNASVNRYIHDFEAMLRRVLAEREGGIIAVTLMSSDMGKLYAALAQAVEKRR
jgi:hypothetical protein